MKVRTSLLVLRDVGFVCVPLNTVAKCNVREKIALGSCLLMGKLEVSHELFKTSQMPWESIRIPSSTQPESRIRGQSWTS